MATLQRPRDDEFAPFYASYIGNVPDDTDVLAYLSAQRNDVVRYMSGLPEELASRRYAEGKWSVRQVLGHLGDSERVFAYRALRIARGDQTPLPGWDQERYVADANFDSRPIGALVADWEAARNATLTLFEGFEPGYWERRGTANDRVVSVRALAYIVAGHTAHHLRILREQYRVI